MGPNETNSARRIARRPDLRQWRWVATELIHELVAAAKLIETARNYHGELVWRRDAQWSLLCAIEGFTARPTISDIARRLRISRQAAHELVTNAARAGRIEVLRNRHDRRIRQVRLTASGRSHLAGIRAAEAGYVITTLNGLDTRELRAAADVVRKVRHGLLRYRDMHERR